MIQQRIHDSQQTVIGPVQNSGKIKPPKSIGPPEMGGNVGSSTPPTSQSPSTLDVHHNSAEKHPRVEHFQLRKRKLI